MTSPQRVTPPRKGSHPFRDLNAYSAAWRCLAAHVVVVAALTSVPTDLDPGIGKGCPPVWKMIWHAVTLADDAVHEAPEWNRHATCPSPEVSPCGISRVRPGLNAKE